MRKKNETETGERNGKTKKERDEKAFVKEMVCKTNGVSKNKRSVIARNKNILPTQCKCSQNMLNFIQKKRIERKK